MIVTMPNIREAILWQFETAARLIGLVDIVKAGYDKYSRDFWDKWYTDVFNIDTANDFGLGIWAKILGVKLSVSFEPQTAKVAFGFGANRNNFHAQTNFGSRAGGTAGLTTSQRRMVIRARHFQLTTRPTVDNINEFLRSYFWKGDSKVYVIDPQDMSQIVYTFLYQPDGELSFLLDNIDILPRPACVGVGINIITGDAKFGFGTNRANFNPPTNFGVL